MRQYRLNLEHWSSGTLSLQFLNATQLNQMVELPLVHALKFYSSVLMTLFDSSVMMKQMHILKLHDAGPPGLEIDTLWGLHHWNFYWVSLKFT